MDPLEQSCRGYEAGKVGEPRRPTDLVEAWAVGVIYQYSWVLAVAKPAFEDDQLPDGN